MRITSRGRLYSHIWIAPRQGKFDLDFDFDFGSGRKLGRQVNEGMNACLLSFVKTLTREKPPLHETSGQIFELLCQELGQIFVMTVLMLMIL
jgi:hypothetical protein